MSEHVAFVRAGGREAGHLLPLPRSRAALDVLTSHVRSVQAELDVPLALEPILHDELDAIASAAALPRATALSRAGAP